MKGHVSKDMTICKGHACMGIQAGPHFSIVIYLIISILYYLIIHLLFTVLYGLLCYILDILDNSYVSELCSSHLVSEQVSIHLLAKPPSFQSFSKKFGLWPPTRPWAIQIFKVLRNFGLWPIQAFSHTPIIIVFVSPVLDHNWLLAI